MAQRPNSRAVKVNFDGVETRGIVEEGLTRLQVEEAEIKEGKKAPYVSWKFKTREGGVVYDNTSMSPKALWRLKAVLEALGETGLGSNFNFMPRRYLRKWLTAEIGHETYNGRPKPVITSYIPPEEADGGETGAQGEEFEQHADPQDISDDRVPGEPDLDDEIPF